MRLVFFIIFSCSETKLISPVISIIPHLFYFIVTSTHFKSEGKIGKVKIIQSPNEKKRFWRQFAYRQNSCFTASPSFLHLNLFHGTPASSVWTPEEASSSR
jgi:hypothetical protein